MQMWFTPTLAMRPALAALFLVVPVGGILAQGVPDKIAAKCLWGIYVAFQAARPHCDTSAPEFDAAIDAALPIMEKRLIDVGAFSAETAEEYRAAEISMWERGDGYTQDREAACQSANPALWGMTPEHIRVAVAAVQAATPDMFSDDCI